MPCRQYESAEFRGGNLTLTDISGNSIDLNLKFAEVRQSSRGFAIHTLKTGSTLIEAYNTLFNGSELTYDIVMNHVAAAKYYSPDEFIGYQQISVAGSVVSLDANVYDDAIKAVIVPEDGTIRWLAFGNTTPPTASFGTPWGDGNGPLTLVTDLSKFRMISAAGTVTVSVMYMR
jgi:hypothetical protein